MIVFALVMAALVSGQSPGRQERFEKMSQQAEAKGLAEPYRGIRIGGEISPGLFEIRSTGVSTEPVRLAAARSWTH